MWTKAQIVADAFGEIALAGHVYDIEPEEQQGALRRLESMLAAWEARGITLRYAFAADAASIEPTTPSGLPESAVDAVVLHLAKKLAPGYGKSLTPQQLQDAKDLFGALLRAAAAPPSMQLPTTFPLGAGLKPWRTSRPYVSAPTSDPLSVNDGGDLDILRG